MPEYMRVKDKSTGHKFSIIASAFDPEAMQELRQDAVDIAGNPLPPEHAEASTASNAKKESDR